MVEVLSVRKQKRVTGGRRLTENQLKVSIELGYADDIAHAKRNIACAKLNYEG